MQKFQQITGQDYIGKLRDPKCIPKEPSEVGTDSEAESGEEEGGGKGKEFPKGAMFEMDFEETMQKSRRAAKAHLILTDPPFGVLKEERDVFTDPQIKVCNSSFFFHPTHSSTENVCNAF